MIPKLTLAEFRERFPNDDVCLEYIFQLKYGSHKSCPKCGDAFSYKRVKGRKSYQCDSCSNQVYPTAGTLLHKTTTPLTYWFVAMYLHTTTRQGIAAKELERALNVCYNTALRMSHRIKMLMGSIPVHPFQGDIVMDEAYRGGDLKNMHLWKKAKRNLTGKDNKIAIFGLMDTKGKRVVTKVLEVKQLNGRTLHPLIAKYVTPANTVITDGSGLYNGLDKLYNHVAVNHQAGIYAMDGHSTNRIENYWSGLSRMYSTHIHISVKHLSKYLGEHTFRYVNRFQPEKMFDLILSRI